MTAGEVGHGVARWSAGWLNRRIRGHYAPRQGAKKQPGGAYVRAASGRERHWRSVPSKRDRRETAGYPCLQIAPPKRDRKLPQVRVASQRARGERKTQWQRRGGKCGRRSADTCRGPRWPSAAHEHHQPRNKATYLQERAAPPPQHGTRLQESGRNLADTLPRADLRSKIKP